MKKPTGPTISFERHQQIGEFLRSARNELVHLCTEVANSRHSKRQKRAAGEILRAQGLIDEARSNLEEVMFSDHPSLATTKIYYGGPT